MLYLLQLTHFLYKIHSNLLPFGEVVLGGNGKLKKKKNFLIKVLFMEKLHYISLPLLPFSTNNQMCRKSTNKNQTRQVKQLIPYLGVRKVKCYNIYLGVAKIAYLDTWCSTSI